MMSRNKALFTSGYQEYITPKWLFKQLDDEFGFTVDPCTTEDNPLGVFCFYTKKEDGLTKSWQAKVGNKSAVYVNPPYHSRNIINWIKKADYESSLGPTVVMLLPARTDTKWFHEYIYKRPRVEIRFLRGRLKFQGPMDQARNTAPFPSMLAIFSFHIHNPSFAEVEEDREKRIRSLENELIRLTHLIQKDLRKGEQWYVRPW